MVISPKHVGAVLKQILTFFGSNSVVHQLVNRGFDRLNYFSVWSNSFKIDLGFLLFCKYFDNAGPFVILRFDQMLI